MLGSVQGGKVLAEKEGNRYDGGYAWHLYDSVGQAHDACLRLLVQALQDGANILKALSVSESKGLHYRERGQRGPAFIPLGQYPVSPAPLVPGSICHPEDAGCWHGAGRVVPCVSGLALEIRVCGRWEGSQARAASRGSEWGRRSSRHPGGVDYRLLQRE